MKCLFWKSLDFIEAKANCFQIAVYFIRYNFKILQYLKPTYDDVIIDPNQPVTYLDQLNITLSSNHYSSIDKLNSHIAFIAPTNLGSWCYLMLGLQCFDLLPTPIIHPDTRFLLDNESKKSPVFPHLNEFVSYILAEDLTNPRMEKLSDFHPDHPLKLDILDRKSVV